MTRPVVPAAFVLQGQRGGLCAVYYPPAAGLPVRGDLLVVPPFGEEMNRCRAMVGLQARELSALGVGTLVLDPYGTGDSAGEFADATWAQWREDLLLGKNWLDEHGAGCVGLLATRLGAVMAGELLGAMSGLQHLVLWQPVTSGKTFYTQFLRIRIAAEMNLPDRVTSTNQLRAMSAAGQPIEVSGYEIGPALADELDGAAFEPGESFRGLQVHWFETSQDDSRAPSPAAAKACEALSQFGAQVRTVVVGGPAFWHVHERELAPELIAATTACVQAWPALKAAPPVLPPHPSAAAEHPLVFACAGEMLSGFLHHGAPNAKRGVVIVVAGGPQYRAGAHRQFVQLARKLARQGVPVLRFDLRGMGDSSGSYLGYQHSDADIRAAIDELAARCPGLDEAVLIGECESASGILFYGWQDTRVSGAVLVNPWVRTEEGQAQVIIKSYYRDRLRQPEFWAKVRKGEFNLVASLKSLAGVLRAYLRGRRMFAKAGIGHAQDDFAGLPLPVKTATGLSRFKGRVLLLMSGHDYIAREFDEVTVASRAWDGLLQSPRLTREDIEGADHTFSRKMWKTAASDRVAAWMRAW